MNKKFRFLAVALTAVTVFSFGSCSDDVKTKIEQLRCEHTMDDGEVVKMATCADVGEKVFTCTLCGYTENEDIPAKGHIWQNVEAVSSACTEDGNTSGINCKVCGEWFMESVKIPATGHSVVIDEGYSPTCTEKGFTDGSHCGVCNEILTSQEELPANGHNVVTVAGKAPTCTEKGFTDGSHCGVCNEILTAQEEIPANGHNVVTVAGKEPTCAETGLTDGSICTVCDEVIIAQEVLPLSADHLDLDRNYYCDNCNTVCPLEEGTYEEVEVSVGEKVVGNWYRIYFNDNTYDNSYLKLTANLGVPSWGMPTSGLGICCCSNSEGEKKVSIGQGLDASFIHLSNSLIKVFVFEDYVDIKIEAGSFIESDFVYPDITEVDEITNETEISQFSAGRVYRLVPTEQ